MLYNQLSTSVKKLEKQLSSNLIALTLDEDSVKGLRVPKIIKKNKFKEVRSELESKKGFQRESVTKYVK